MATKYVGSLCLKLRFASEKNCLCMKIYIWNKGGGSFYLHINIFEGFGYETRAEAVFISDQETFKGILKTIGL